MRFHMCGGGLNWEGGLFEILAQRGGAYQRVGLIRAFTVRQLCTCLSRAEFASWFSLRHFVLSGAAPFESLMVADVGDMCINPFNLTQAVSQIKTQTSTLIKDGCKPLIMGGDHTISYPILQAMKVSISSMSPPAICFYNTSTALD